MGVHRLLLLGTHPWFCLLGPGLRLVRSALSLELSQPLGQVGKFVTSAQMKIEAVSCPHRCLHRSLMDGKKPGGNPVLYPFKSGQRQKLLMVVDDVWVRLFCG